jgi:hypothetical protein
MEMKDGLASVLALIDDQTVAAPLGKPKLLAHVPGRQKNLPQESSVIISGIGNARHVLFRNHEHMRGSNGTDVSEGKNVLILEHKVPWNLPTNDAAKEAVVR